MKYQIEKCKVPVGEEYQADRRQGHGQAMQPGQKAWMASTHEEVIHELPTREETEAYTHKCANHSAVQKASNKILNYYTNKISKLCTENKRLTSQYKLAALELRRIRRALAEHLFELKTMLSKPSVGKSDLWKQLVREMLIPHWTVNSLINRYAVSMGGDNQVIPRDGAADPEREFAQRMAKLVWSDAMPFLTSSESVVQLIAHVLKEAGVCYEKRKEGLFIPNPIGEDAAMWERSHPVTGTLRQPCEEGSAAATDKPKSETANTPLGTVLPVASDGAGAGVAA